MELRPRWKYAEAEEYMRRNPISQAYERLRSSPPMMSFLSGTAIILQVVGSQADLLLAACFGRPILAGPKTCVCHEDSKSGSSKDSPSSDGEEDALLYELSFEEAFFLCHELKCLHVFSNGHKADTILDDGHLWQMILKRKHGFVHFYKAYAHLRLKNWVVRSGLQFGAHYVAYRHSPVQVHAEYAVTVVPEWEKQVQVSSWSHLQGIIRLCGSVAKSLLLLHITSARLDINHPSCLEFYTIQEVEVARWLPKKHRMDAYASADRALDTAPQAET